MAGSFGNQDGGSDRGGKRPVPTIEGTATEVSDESTAEDSATAEDTNETPAQAEEAEPEKSAATDDENGSAGTETEAPKPAPERVPRGSGVSGVISYLAAGLLGGLAGAGALAAAWGYLPMGAAPEGPDITPLEDRLVKLEAAPASKENDAAIAKLEARLADIENQEPEMPREVTALADRVSQLESSLKSMADAAKDGGSLADAAAVSQQINEAEQRLETKIDKALAEGRSANAESIGTLRKDIAALDAKLKALTEAELGSGDAAELGPEIDALDDRLAKLEEVLPTLATELEGNAADIKAATLAMAFANLRAAVSEGRPYAAELATLAALSPGNGELGSLLDYEDKGIPTLAELTRSFEQAKDAALDTPAASADASVLDRLAASAESLVKIRRVDAQAEGDAPDAVLARAETKLETGDLAAAVKEVETLEGAPRAAFATWLDQARARLDADATLKELQNILLVSLGGGGGAPEQSDAQEGP